MSPADATGPVPLKVQRLHGLASVEPHCGTWATRGLSLQVVVPLMTATPLPDADRILGGPTGPIGDATVKAAISARKPDSRPSWLKRRQGRLVAGEPSASPLRSQRLRQALPARKLIHPQC